MFMAVSLGFESAITYFVSNGDIDSDSMQFFAWVWIVIATGITVLFSFIFIKNDTEFAERSILILFTVLFVSGNLIITFFNSLFYAKHRYLLPNLVYIFTNLVLISVMLKPQLFSISKSSFILLFFYSYLFQGFVTAILYNSLFTKWKNFQLPSTIQLQKIIKYSSTAFLSGLLFYLATRIDYFFIDYYLKDKEVLGNYIQASRLVQLFQMLPAVLAAGIFPIAASGYAIPMREGIIKLSRVIFLLYIIITCTLLLTGNWLFPFLFGNTFNQMYLPFIFLVPGLFALSLLALMAAYFAAINKTKWNFFIAAAGLLIIIPMDVLLIPIYGIHGAAVASSTGYCLCFIIAYFYFTKEKKIPISDFILFKKTDILFLLNTYKKIKSNTTSNPI